MAACIGCGAAEIALLLDFGAQPPSNRFVVSIDAPQDSHRLAIGQCERCALVQLVDPMPAEMARSRFDWLTYNEPEGHLDDLVARLARLPGMTPAARILGLTYKDDSSLARFNRLGFADTVRLDPRGDLGMVDPCAGLETVQAAADPARCRTIAARRGQADLVLVRHVLEHAHSPRVFLAALAELVRPGGYLVFEMPDCSKFVAACDYSFVWEEHIAYFSPATLRAVVAANGLDLAEEIVYPYAFEDSLVGIVRRAAPDRAPTGPLPVERTSGRRFGERFGERRRAYLDRLEAARGAGKRIAIFGAGHLAAKFVNVFGLGPLVDCVVDDNPHKRDLRMPGSRLPIVGSGVLADGSVDLCLLSLSPESERKVLDKHAAFVQRGGEFRSIFALSPIALVPAAA